MQNDNFTGESHPGKSVIEVQPLASQSGIVADAALGPRSRTYDFNASSVHAFSAAEKTAFVKHINAVLKAALELKAILPIDPASNDIFTVVRDGILLWYVNIHQNTVLINFCGSSNDYCNLANSLMRLFRKQSTKTK
jgi:hypothetical protein